MCGASLVTTAPLLANDGSSRADSPAPFFNQTRVTNTEVTESIKLSFRDGGEKTYPYLHIPHPRRIPQ